MASFVKSYPRYIWKNNEWDSGGGRVSVPEVELTRTHDIRFIMKMMERNTQKKFTLMQNYIYKNHPDIPGFDDFADLETDLEALSRDELSDLYDFLDQTFSSGQPYFVYKFALRQDVTQEQLKESIQRCFPIDTPKSVDTEFPRVEIKRLTEIHLRPDDHLRFTVQYERFVESLRMDNDGGISDSKTTYDVIFDFKESLLYFNCGDSRCAVATRRVFSGLVMNTFSELTIFSVSHLMKQVVFENEFRLDRQTVVVLEYLENTIEQKRYEVSDYSRIAFQNMESEKVKGVRINGSNLFESIEMAERIRLGDRIKSVKFTLTRTHDSRQNAGGGVTTTVRMDFTGALKILFSDEDNVAYQLDFVRHIMETFQESLNKTYNETEVRRRIQPMINKAEAKDNLTCNRILSELREKVEQQIGDLPSRTAVLELIDGYIG